MKLYISITLIFIVVALFAADDANAVEIQFNTSSLRDEITLGEYLTVYRDRTSAMGIEEIRRLPKQSYARPKTSNPSFGFDSSPLWAKITLRHDGSDSRQLVFRYGYSFADHIYLYQIGADSKTEEIRRGDMNIDYKAAIFNRLPAFEVTVRPGLNHFYFKLETRGRQLIPLKLMTVPAYRQAEIIEYAIIAASIGIFIAMIGYNLFLFVSFRSRIYLLYSVYMASFAFYILGVGGILNLFPVLDFNNNWLGNEGIVVSASVTSILMGIFTTSFLNTRSYLPRVFWIFPFCYGLLITAVIVLHWYSYSLGTLIASLTITVLMLIIFLAGIYSAGRRYRPAYFFSIAFFIVIVANILASLKFAGVLPYNALTNWAQNIGGSLESILLSLALGDRVNYYRHKTQENLTKLNRQNQHSYEQLSKIVYPHQISLIKDGGMLENTMPLHEAEAYVLCFDVISSSQVRRAGFHDFLSSFFAACYDLMSEGYHESTLQSRGFRIKEVGDGFFCSLGYPFQYPGELTASEAFSLAELFLKLFHKMAREYDADLHLHGSCGVAYGGLQGNYPASGPREYDLHGRGLILAHRYENFRKDITGFDDQTSIIILQSIVFDQLTPAEQQSFARVPLEAGRLQVRDDPSATELYYLTIDDLADEPASA